jgi:hypothetical protein
VAVVPVGVGLDDTVGDGLGVVVGVVGDGLGDAVANGLGLDVAGAEGAAATGRSGQTNEPLNASTNATAAAHQRPGSLIAPPGQLAVRDARLSLQLARSL